MFASLLFLPFGLTQPLFVPDYWNPTVIYKLWGLFDIESLLFGFFLGGIAASLYEEIFNYHLRKFGKTLTNKNYARIIYGSMIAFALFLIFIKFYTELSVIWSSFIFILVVSPYFLMFRKDLIKESLIGGFIFMLFYILTLLITNYFFSNFVSNEWNFNGTLGINLLGLPLEEYIYSLFFGIVASVIYEEIKNIKIVRYNKR
ncbi:MAG: lycopene cyclase domain-containing protein [Nanoarchaeota archaeon]